MNLGEEVALTRYRTLFRKVVQLAREEKQLDECTVACCNVLASLLAIHPDEAALDRFLILFRELCQEEKRNFERFCKENGDAPTTRT